MHPALYASSSSKSHTWEASFILAFFSGPCSDIRPINIIDSSQRLLRLILSSSCCICGFFSLPSLRIIVGGRVKTLDWSRHDHNIHDKVARRFTVIGKELNDPTILQENVYNMDETGVLLSVLSSLKEIVAINYGLNVGLIAPSLKV
jgi:hypothetical protein